MLLHPSNCIRAAVVVGGVVQGLKDVSNEAQQNSLSFSNELSVSNPQCKGERQTH